MRATWLRFLDWLSHRFGIGRTPVPREPVSIRPIGVVRNGIKQPAPHGWAGVRSDIILRVELRPALDGIEGYTHIIVAFAFDKVPDAERKVYIDSSDPRIPRLGVLATRSQVRPSPIGVSVVRLIRRRHNILRVEGLDAIDGAPVLDIKPYYPNYDAIADAGIPDWTRHLAKD